MKLSSKDPSSALPDQTKEGPPGPASCITRWPNPCFREWEAMQGRQEASPLPLPSSNWYLGHITIMTSWIRLEVHQIQHPVTNPGQIDAPRKPHKAIMKAVTLTCCLLLHLVVDNEVCYLCTWRVSFLISHQESSTESDQGKPIESTILRCSCFLVGKKATKEIVLPLCMPPAADAMTYMEIPHLTNKHLKALLEQTKRSSSLLPECRQA